MTRVSWHMRDVPPAERFAYWREAVCQSFMPLEPEDLSDNHFDGGIDGVGGTSLHISRVQSVPAVVQRTRRGIGKLLDGSFYANLQLYGDAIVEQNGERAIARPGDIVLVDTNEPFSIRFEHGCDLLCATIPDGSLRRHLQHFTKRPNVIRSTGAGRLASAYLSTLRDLREDFETVDDLAGEQLSTLLIRAASAEIGVADAPTRRETTLRRILDFITDQLDNPLLSAKFVCRELKLSRSSLFAILGDSDIAFASYIRGLRLERCVGQLRDPRLSGVAVGDIARRAGFASQASFTRAFTRRYGAPPGSYRSKSDI
ncbi:helix-turn-helix domain-containing protein [Bradyrhizobium sp. CCGB12]|uniref:AraC-like ligand-binding domain-containing protein n=1 Tax=Bradyrhizobium sp. CCGB12 TaxID=2949632 RepID=UPI0020B2A225|nr:helix-turn-helix domain-containing protein [Bradyrhizobium sp. CCGB12]MCP3387832.1 helix-turn-helix domain-containing protein [Bradyrhizobium sp. CCGB12]